MRIEPNFEEFNRELAKKLAVPLTQEIHVRTDTQGVTRALNDINNVGTRMRSAQGAADSFSSSVLKSSTATGTLENRLSATNRGLVSYTSSTLAGAAATEKLTSATDELARARLLAAATPTPDAPIATGGGGGGRVNVVHTLSGGGGGGNDNNILGKLLFGGGGGIHIPFTRVGVAGAGAGSLASLGGFGAEHILTTILGLAGFAAAGAAGAATAGVGALGRTAVGGGADALATKTTISNTQAIGKAYDKLQTTIQQYGANSKEAARAQTAFNESLQKAGPAAQAELKLYKQVQALNDLWQKTSAGAQKQSAAILSQTVTLGTDFAPRVAAAAQKNLSIINTGLKPLFAFLEGPQGIKIFDDLENKFAKQLPFAVHAGSQALELFLKFVDEASNQTGGFAKKLDTFFTKLNQEPPHKLHDFVHTLLDDFHAWESLLKHLGQDIFLFFSQDVGTAHGIVHALDDMLIKLGDWERSTKGKRDIHNIFEVHKKEIDELLQVLPLVFNPLGRFYLAVAPAVTTAFTHIATAVASVLTQIEKLGPAGDALIGLGVIALKFLGISKTFALAAAAIKTATGLKVPGGPSGGVSSILNDKKIQTVATMEVGELIAKNFISGGGAGGGLPIGKAGKEGADLAQAESRSFVSKAKGFITEGLGRAARGGVIAIGGLLATDFATSFLHGGVKKAVGDIGKDASIGAGIGSVFGPEGTAGGAIVGGLVGTIGYFTDKHAKDEGKKWADSFAKGLPGPIDDAMKRALAKAGADVAKSPTPNTPISHTSVPGQVGPATLNQLSQQVSHAQEVLRISQQAAAGHAPPLSQQGEVLSIAAANAALRRARENFNEAFNRNFRSSFNALFRQGRTAGQAFVQGFEHIQIKTTPEFITEAKDRLSKLKGPARDEAAKTMIEYAHSLEKHGDLPKGATDRIIRSLEGKYAGLKPFLESQGEANNKAVTKKLTFQGAVDNLVSAERQVKKKFGNWPHEPDINGKNYVDVFNVQLSQLHTIADHTTGKAHTAAMNNIRALKRDAKVVLGNMVTDFDTSTGAMSDDFKHGPKGKKWAPAMNQLQSNLSTLESNIGTLVAGGAVSMTQGSQGIYDALVAALTAIGGGKLPSKPALSVAGVQSKVLAGVGSAVGKVKNLFGAAGGALIQVGTPGAAGYDAIPMNVGGQPIVVGDGEQVAVLNRHQQRFLNGVLAPVGGMQGMFDTINQPHYAATGGYVYPFAPSFGRGRTDMGLDMTGSGPIAAVGDATFTRVSPPNSGTGWPLYSERDGRGALMTYRLDSGPRAGNYIYLAENVTPASGLHSGSKLKAGDVFAQGHNQFAFLEMGWAANPSGTTLSAAHGTQDTHPNHANTPEGIDFTNFIFGLAHGKLVGGGAFGGIGAPAPTWTDLKHPRVGGDKSTILDMVQRGLNREVDAANKYGRKQAAKLGGTTGTSTSGSTAGLRGNEMQIVRQLAQRFGWSNQVADWAYVLNRESNGTLTDTNPSSGAYGLAQFINGPSEYYKYGGNPNTYAGQLLAMANYIKQRYGNPAAAAAHERANNWYAKGGIVPGFAGGGLVQRFSKGGKPTKPPKKITPPKHIKPPKAPHLSKLRDLPNFQVKSRGKVINLPLLDTTDSDLQDFGNWQGLVENIHSSIGSVSPTITDASGNDVLNFGTKTGLPPVRYQDLTGLVDPASPSAGPTMGIWDRVRQITEGPPIGTTEYPVSMGDVHNTELGMDQYLVNQYIQERGYANALLRYLGSTKPQKGWLGRLQGIVNVDTENVAYLKRGLDDNFMFDHLKSDFRGLPPVLLGWTSKFAWGGKRPITESAAKLIKEKVRAVKNLLAQVTWLKLRRQKFPNEERDRKLEITNRYAKARKDLQIDKMKGTLSKTSLQKHLLAGLSEREQNELSKIVKPSNWAGDQASWNAQSAADKAAIRNSFTEQRTALENTLAAKRLGNRINAVNARWALNQGERNEKTSVEDQFGTKRNEISNTITNDNILKKAGKEVLSDYLKQISTQLTGAQGNINTALGGGDPTASYSAKLHEYVDPGKTLDITIKTLQDITIPGLQHEVQVLAGTTLPVQPPGTGSDGGTASALADLNVTLLRLKNESAMIQVLQDQVLKGSGIPLTGNVKALPFGGSYATGGVVPGPPGAPIMIEAHGGEVVTPQNQMIAGDTHVHISGNDAWLKNIINVEVEKHTRGQARSGIRASTLASTSGRRF